MEKIYSKIEKLMAMIDGGVNENEIKNAKKMLIKILSEHDIKNYKKGSEIITIGIETGKKRIDIAESSLFSVCSEFCGCFYYYVQGYGRYVITGTKKNLDDSLYLFNSLRVQLDAKSCEWYESQKKIKKMSATYKNEFRRSMSSTIGNRLYDITRGHIKYNGEMGLVVYGQQAFKDAENKVNSEINIKEIKHKNYTNIEALKAGDNAGKNASINHRIDNKKSQTMIK